MSSHKRIKGGSDYKQKKESVKNMPSKEHFSKLLLTG